MHIGIDYTAAAWQGAGIGRYTRDLVRAVVERAVVERAVVERAASERAVAERAEYRFTLFYAAGGLDEASPLLADLQQLTATYAQVRAVPIRLTPRRLTQLWHRAHLPLPIEVFTGPLDVLHAPDYVLPPSICRRAIVTIHDLSYIVHPEYALPSVARYLNVNVPRSLARSRLVFADSNATREDIIAHLGVAAERVLTVYPGVGAQFRPLAPEATAEAAARLGLPPRFLLFVSTIEPRKNLVRVLEALATLRTRGRDLPPLLVAGRRGWMYEPVFAAIERLGLGDAVRFLDFVSDADLPMLYNRAEALVYPSIYEGFGFPPLEALACGAVVVTSNTSSLPEVVGDAALTVDPTDVVAIADALDAATSDDDLRRTLRGRGPQQAARFRWALAAEQVLTSYRSVGARVGRQ